MLASKGKESVCYTNKLDFSTDQFSPHSVLWMGHKHKNAHFLIHTVQNTQHHPGNTAFDEGHIDKLESWIDHLDSVSFTRAHAC